MNVEVEELKKKKKRDVFRAFPYLLGSSVMIKNGLVSR
jgi:hypothetical protein